MVDLLLSDSTFAADVIDDHSTMVLYYDPIYTDGIHPDARFPRTRYRKIAEAIRASDLDISIRTSPRANREVMVLAHDPAYVDAFLEGRLDEKAKRQIGLRPWTDAIIPRTCALVGGAIGSMDFAIRTGGVGANMAGGTHHAFRSHGSGYCIFNDLAICVRLLQHRGDVKRIAIVDLDVHQGDGTASMLAADPDVLTISVHCESNFPFRKERSDLDLALPQGTEDEAYLLAVDKVLSAAAAFEPELVFFQAGVDPLKEDALGRMNVSRDGLRARNEKVFRLVQTLGIPLVVSMGGGYAKEIEASVAAFVDLFAGAARCHRRKLGLA